MGYEMTAQAPIDRRTRAGREAAQTSAVQIGAPALVAPQVQSDAANPVSVAESNAPTPKVLRRKRASTGGFKLRLDAPPRAGYVRRWVHDDPNRILAMEELGYQFADADTRTDGLGSRVTRHAGKGENGQPTQLVLMETPESEYAVGMAEKEERLKPFEEALRAGQDTTGKVDGAYSPAAKSSLTHSG